ncbi:MAG: hypothetical protein QM820_35015 [Minicystis sp.]
MVHHEQQIARLARRERSPHADIEVAVLDGPDARRLIDGAQLERQPHPAGPVRRGRLGDRDRAFDLDRRAGQQLRDLAREPVGEADARAAVIEEEEIVRGQLAVLEPEPERDGAAQVRARSVRAPRDVGDAEADPRSLARRERVERLDGRDLDGEADRELADPRALLALVRLEVAPRVGHARAVADHLLGGERVARA